MSDWLTPPQPPAPQPKAEDPGFWEGLLLKLRKMGLTVIPAPQHPVHGLSGEPTVNQIPAMGQQARRRNLLDSYRDIDNGDIPKTGGN